jgi:hypothetical protein
MAQAPLKHAAVALARAHDDSAPGSSIVPLQSLSTPSQRSGRSMTHGDAMMKNEMVSGPTPVVSVRSDVLVTRFPGATSPAAVDER